MPAILRGGDVVLAAETGSGKTLAYLAPLVDWALRSRRAAAAAEAAREQQREQEHEGRHGEPHGGHRPHRARRGTATLVLCPNAALCEQVAGAAAALRDASTGTPLVAAALVSSQSPPPLQLPDIVVTTPGALVSLMDNAGPAYGYEWTRAGALRQGSGQAQHAPLAEAGRWALLRVAPWPPSHIASSSWRLAGSRWRRRASPLSLLSLRRAGLPEWARRVVFDEADLLLSGAYGAQMRIIWDALRAGDRLHAARRVCAEVGARLGGSLPLRSARC